MAYLRKTADIVTSNEFDYVLEQIKDNSEVARLLLKQRHSLETLQEDYIDYISISNSDKTKISYLTKERIQYLQERGECVWSSSKRFHIKPGAFVQKLFKNITPREIEVFSTLFRNIQSKIDFKFKVVKGVDILEYYYHESYRSGSGSLGNSCMKYDSCQPYLSLYTKNKKQCNLLIAIDDYGKLIGRALLWNLGETKIMDRIYTINDEEFQFHFKKWADENDFIYKREQKWNNTLYFESKGKTLFKEISFTLENLNFDQFPYMDTFKFINFDTKTLYNYIPKGIDVKTISSADGDYQDGDIYAFCEKTKTLHSNDNLNYLQYLDMTVCSDICIFSDIHDCYILREDAVYDNYLRDWIYRDEKLNNEELISEQRKRLSMNSFDLFTPEKLEELKNSLSNNIRTSWLESAVDNTQVESPF